MPRAPDPRLPKTCIIGAGSSGIAAAKVFTEYGMPFDCFEKSDRVGGNWVFKNKNGDVVGLSVAAHQHLARQDGVFGFSDAARAFPTIRITRRSRTISTPMSIISAFATTSSSTPASKRAEQTADGLWKVTLESGEKRLYDALVVANGHHWDPRWPEPAFPGSFDGQADPLAPLHRSAASRSIASDKNVLVVGFGNSALDIACELGRKGVAKNVFLSQRRGYWVMPKYIGGEVLDARVPHPSQDPPWLQRGRCRRG